MRRYLVTARSYRTDWDEPEDAAKNIGLEPAEGTLPPVLFLRQKLIVNAVPAGCQVQKLGSVCTVDTRVRARLP